MSDPLGRSSFLLLVAYAGPYEAVSPAWPVLMHPRDQEVLKYVQDMRPFQRQRCRYCDREFSERATCLACSPNCADRLCGRTPQTARIPRQPTQNMPA